MLKWTIPVILILWYPRIYRKIINWIINSPVLYYWQKTLSTTHSILGKLNIYHSKSLEISITPVPCGADNYAYLYSRFFKIVEVAVAIDPVDPKRLLNALYEIDSQIQLTHVLITHKHWDHAGGNRDLVKKFPGLVIVGSSLDFPENGLFKNFYCVNKRVVDKENVIVGRLVFKVLYTPCHTMGSVMYLLEIDKIQSEFKEFEILKDFTRDGLDVDSSSLFTGDTIFTGGIGKFFEGDASDMHFVIQRLLLDLDYNTLIWPGHEYTLENLEFAIGLESNNSALKVRYQQAIETRVQGLCTVPSTWKYELMTNPFLRIDYRTRDEELWINIKKNLKDFKYLVKSVGSSFEKTKEIQEIVMLDCLRSLKDKWKSKKE